ncbi:epoxide hydrolase family protein [Mycobacterium sp. DL440]|uniref:epoxide hydrolase family protein n=1 Tax=Mycobacterium sp. DL440 TaxID=2675523 RepID=UPI0014202B15|nr:epoxide hydrolase family protein [Mycobacterium sp. DL440]
MNTNLPVPFRIDVPQDKLDRILERVRTYQWFPVPAGAATNGVDPDLLFRLTQYWSTNYDWRQQERQLNQLPQYTVDIDGNTVHFVHERGSAKDSKLLVLLHGWPYTYAGLLPLVERLAHPERFGGTVEDGFDVVVPSLPGFGFSGRLQRPLGPRATADLMNRLFTDVLGYDSYLLHGGDWGGIVAEWTAFRHPERVSGLHLNLAFTRHDGGGFGSGETGAGPATALELEWAAAEKAIFEREFVYFQLQAFDPLTLSYALMDSPVGLAAWVTDKFLHWADTRHRAPESAFSWDVLLTEVMLYLVTDSFLDATTLYSAIVQEGPSTLPPGRRIEVPTGFAAFPDPHCPPPPRSIVERSHHVIHWTDMPQGGHFPALEQPTALIGDIQDFSKLLVG